VGKKPIVLINEELRFYKKDGWCEGDLNKHLSYGQFIEDSPYSEDPYYTLSSSSKFIPSSIISEMSHIERDLISDALVSDLELLTTYSVK